ncbi:MAG TPA: DsbA family protein [Anaerolineales bacterium]|nr:DsbA family protein [Anaerolineales bacterium]
MNEIPSPSPQQEDTITFKRSHFYLVLVVLAFAVGVLVGYMAWGRNSSAAQQPSAAQNSDSQPSVVEAPISTGTPQYVRYKIPTDGFPSLGPANAPITIVEFSDFECPFCRNFQQETYQSLMNAYPGKIRFVYRNFPLTSIHPDAFAAAVASRCANEQNAFWPYHDKLFSSDQLGQDQYVLYATQLGLDVNAFKDCLASDRNNKFIQDDSDFATQLGVNSTPTFFINGLAVIGAQPLDVFKQVIDKELAGQIPQ